MKVLKVESGRYRTVDERFDVVQDWTSVRGGMQLVRCWKVLERGRQVKTCKTLGEAKDYVSLRYAS